MQVNAYLLFNGQCEAAFRFYEQSLRGKITAMMTHAGTPAEEQTPKEWLNKIIHARMNVGDGVLMGSDSPPDHYKTPQGFYVSLQIKEPPEANRIFTALSEAGTVQMPIQKTFWAIRFGMLVDKFGIPWMVNCEQTS